MTDRYVYSVPLRKNSVLHKLDRLEDASYGRLDLAVGEVAELHPVAWTVCGRVLQYWDESPGQGTMQHCEPCWNPESLEERKGYRDRAIGKALGAHKSDLMREFMQNRKKK